MTPGTVLVLQRQTWVGLEGGGHLTLHLGQRALLVSLQESENIGANMTMVRLLLPDGLHVQWAFMTTNPEHLTRLWRAL